MKIAITTGDVDGIGLEVTLKALARIKIPRNAEVHIYLHSKFTQKARKKLPKTCQLISRDDSPAIWVEEAIQNCLNKKMDVLVTGPLSKPEFIRAGFSDLGHTEMLARMTKKSDLVMSFWGKTFNLALLTNHLPLSSVSTAVTFERILQVHSLCQKALETLDPQRKRYPNLLLGLNPHAGDQGLIGTEEAQWKPVPGLRGPVPADSAFEKEALKKIGVIIACYHDQGLIPFKMAHGFKTGVHVTLGLPFLRTSVDHGPAKDLFGKNKAEMGSMKAAIEMALKWKTPKTD